MRPTSCRCRPATSPATAAATRPRSSCSDGPFDLGVDWRGEVAAARRARADAEAASRDPERLAGFRTRRPPRARRRRHAGAGGQDRAAARALGDATSWSRPGARAAVARLARRLRLHQGARRAGADRDRRATCRSPSCARRSSSRRCAEPRPGWIRGFRMAEPVIISYARGLLKEFPGVPEGTVDVIPVDLVVGAIFAVAALGPEQAPPDHAGRVGLGKPAALPRPRRPRAPLVHRAPALRQRRAADRRRPMVVPRRLCILLVHTYCYMWLIPQKSLESIAQFELTIDDLHLKMIHKVTEFLQVTYQSTHVRPYPSHLSPTHAFHALINEQLN